jgi:chemotaxis protein CheC
MDISTDIIKEVINIGIGEAAFALSELVNAPVKIRMPEIRVLNVAAVPKYINDEIKNLGIFISQDFRGLLEGKVLLSYSRACSLSLINVLLREDKDMTSLTKTDIATLQEIGNIIMVSCLSTISNLIEGTLTFTMPQVVTGLSEQYFNHLVYELARFEQCIVVKSEMTIKGSDIQGYIFILLSFKDLQVIITRLNLKMQASQSNPVA